MSLVDVSRDLCRAVERLSFGPPVACVYNPLVYARAPHEAYLERYGIARGRVVLFGMNPGPFGMVQTGVPFGEVALVRDFLGIEGRVDKPKREHPSRPVLGFACTRSEVSGARLWGWARARFSTADAFFARFFVANYCPLAFVEDSGRNRTPDKLPPHEREPLFAACDKAMAAAIDVLAPSLVVGIGGFAEKRAKIVLGARVPIGCIPHPSPASPLANRGWADAVDEALKKLGV